MKIKFYFKLLIFVIFKIFSKIGEHERKNYFSRLQIVFGDLTEEINLGISTQDQNQMNNEVEIIYHVAADVRFDENLSDAILANVRGTREILKLAGNISSLKAFIYVSTSFSTANFNVKETCKKIFVIQIFSFITFILKSLSTKVRS